MNGFEILFELFTLLLGLAVAELLSGFAGLMKLRARLKQPAIHGEDGAPVRGDLRVGWLLPLLAAIFLFHLSTFWIDMFQLRQSLPLNLLSIVLMLAIIGAYYVLANLIFPDEPDRWPDFDAYFFAHRRFIILMMLGLSLAIQIILAVVGIEWPVARVPAHLVWVDDADTLAGLASFLAMLAAAFTRSRWATSAALAIAIIGFGVTIAASALGVGVYVA